ncbi:MAG: ATP-binding protein [Bacteroidales bacterium]|nr:ATP-binding protein [Bacteroidales bacterium]
MEIAIISGKGGTGKSSISAAFATLAGKVALADCDVDAANLYLLFNPDKEMEEVFTGADKALINYNLCSSCGLCIDYCRFDAIFRENGKIIISEFSCDGCSLCKTVCPAGAITMVQNDNSRLYSGSFRYGKMVYGRLAPGEENSGKLVNLVRDKIKKTAQENDITNIIIDGPPGIGCPVISTISGVDKVIIVTEPSISGLNDMQRAIELTKKFNIQSFVIINKFDINPDITERIGNRCNEEKIQVIGRLPYDIKMVEAMVAGKSIIEWAPEAALSGIIHCIYNKIIN